MLKKLLTSVCLLLILFVVSAGNTLGRPAIKQSKEEIRSFSAVTPSYCIVNHRIGKIVLAVSNTGMFGDYGDMGGFDCFTGDGIHACEYPKNSRHRYLFAGAFWIGAVVGRDTLVSTGRDGWTPPSRELNPDESPFGDMKYRSIRFPDVPALFEGAVSEEDYIAVYHDTFTDGTDNDASGRPHRPLYIEVTQNSYAWSYPYAEDFVLFDYQIRNVGVSLLENVYMGVYVDADVHAEAIQGTQGASDDICGFIETYPAKFNSCDFLDTVNMAWIIDNDGDPLGSAWGGESVRNVTATRIVRTPADQLDVSFNWWVSNGTPNLDFGPRERSLAGRLPEEFRNFRTGTLGTASGDADKYYQLRNREFDYDQPRILSIQSTDSLWTYPPQELAADIADGYDTRYLLSFGPFDINPGEKLPISFAYLGGENVHTDPSNIDNLPSDLNAYYNGLDFDDLALNSSWASRVYDNPGVDTDSNGTAGKFRVCCTDTSDTLCDTLYYEGDGVPDFRGASPPPAPTFWLEPSEGKIRIRFNGQRSETAQDVFSRENDFEGYRVYIGRDEREASFSLAASYDVEDYNKMVWNPSLFPEAGFELKDVPFTLQELRCLYADSCNDATFDPLAYSRTFPFVHPNFPDSIFFFEPQDFNASEFGVTTPIRKIYPAQPYPSSLDTSEADPNELTPDGFFKYFEYGLEIDNLLPTVEWFLNVTAFDFGSPESGLKSLETAKSSGPKATFALSSNAEIAQSNLEAFVYPNPYRLDAGYREQGYEGRLDVDRPNDRVRRIHFANLPPKCTIKIYTLDGDLVREIDHDKPVTDPEANHNEWDLITRNTQLAVSGIYYWTIESADGDTQIGKLVLIM